MPGTAVNTGEQVFWGALAGILGALDGSEAPVRDPLPSTTTQPQRMGMIAGMSIGTIALIGLGVFAIVKLSK